MNTKYIIFNVDDTLLKSDRTVSEFTLKVLKFVQSLGHKIIMNTARSKDFNQEYFDLIKPDYAILNGGSLIIDKDEKDIYKVEIAREIIDELTDDLLITSNSFSIYTDDGLFSSDPDYHGQNAIYFDFKNNHLSKPSTKIVVNMKSQMLAEQIAKKYDLIYVAYLSGKFGRFNLKETSKENGNKILMNLLGGDLKDCIVFGDDHGDLNMINEAGEGVLMKNADDALKLKVKNISKYSNDEDGIARYLVDKFNIALSSL